jgi:hypothetical protein
MSLESSILIILWLLGASVKYNLAESHVLSFSSLLCILFSEREHSHFYIALTFVEWLPFAVRQSLAETVRDVTVLGGRPESRNITGRGICLWTINISKDTPKQWKVLTISATYSSAQNLLLCKDYACTSIRHKHYALYSTRYTQQPEIHVATTLQNF